MISIVSPASGVLEHLNICLRALLRVPLFERGREPEGESVDTFLLIGLTVQDLEGQSQKGAGERPPDNPGVPETLESAA